MTPAIRAATHADAAAIAAIYAYYVAETTITFEEQPPDAAEIAARIGAAYPWRVAERDGAVIGYAYAYPYRARAAYRWVAETGIYLAPDAHGGGLGTALYQALLAALAEAGFVAAVGVLALPNPASEALHARTGFRRIGVQEAIGFKHGRWLDVAIWQRDLADRRVPETRS